MFNPSRPPGSSANVGLVEALHAICRALPRASAGGEAEVNSATSVQARALAGLQAVLAAYTAHVSMHRVAAGGSARAPNKESAR